MIPPYTRTTCGCRDCVQCCKDQPGALSAGEFERIATFLGETREQAKLHFWASPGALVGHKATNRVWRVGTITPRKVRGRCVFLNPDDSCRIHAVAPFGCAFFDTHMGRQEGAERSAWLVQQTQGADYQALRAELPFAASYRPRTV